MPIPSPSAQGKPSEARTVAHHKKGQETQYPPSVPEVTVALTSDEALVLFELLHRWEESGRIGTALMSGEQTALWALSGRLESVLMEPFEGNYRESVNHARRRLAERGGA